MPLVHINVSRYLIAHLQHFRWYIIDAHRAIKDARANGFSSALRMIS